VEEQPQSINKWLAWIIFAVLVGSLLRILACSTQFWLDEVWSWRSALEIKTPLQVFTSIHNDNNHYLNTLWMFMLGNQKDWWLYRLPSLIAGIISIPLMALIASRQGRFQAVSAALSTAFCYFLVLYSSEARGFAGAVLFSLLCLDQMQRYFQRKSLLHSVLFTLFAVAGLLSQLTFLYAYFAMAIWGLYCAVKDKTPSGTLAGYLAYTFPIVAFFTLGKIDWQYWIVGGGPKVNALQSASAAASLVLGQPLDRLFSPLMLCVVSAVIIYECVMQAREGRNLWVLYGSALFLTPAMALVIAHPDAVYPRHFVICAPFFLLLFADFCARIWRTRRKHMAIIVMAVFCLANTTKAVAFFRDGRGQYIQAVTHLSQSDDRTVGSTFDFQTSMMIAYYNQFLPPDRQLVFVPQKEWPRDPPQWIINSLWNMRKDNGSYVDIAGDFMPAPRLNFPFGTYQLVKEYPFTSEVSGSSWVIYHREEARQR
jgi:hypothetical protein